jgi:hypothetical protein
MRVVPKSWFTPTSVSLRGVHRLGRYTIVLDPPGERKTLEPTVGEKEQACAECPAQAWDGWH